MAVQVYINFNGNCREAVEYYASVFKTEKPRMMFFGDMPSEGANFPEEIKKLVMHAALQIGDSTLMFSDTTPDRAVTVGNNMSLIVLNDDMEMIKGAFNKMKEDGAQVIMELGETFFSKCYGQVVDKFGIGWQFNCEK